MPKKTGKKKARSKKTKSKAKPKPPQLPIFGREGTFRQIDEFGDPLPIKPKKKKP